MKAAKTVSNWQKCSANSFKNGRQMMKYSHKNIMGNPSTALITAYTAYAGDSSANDYGGFYSDYDDDDLERMFDYDGGNAIHHSLYSNTAETVSETKDKNGD